jgi:hypothetical protein
LCLGLDHGFELGRIIHEHASDLEAQALAFAELTQVEAEQCYRAVADEDRDRSLTWRGSQPPGAYLGRSFAGFVRQCVLPTVMLDAEIAQAILRRSNLLDAPDALGRDACVLQRVMDLQPDVPRSRREAFLIGRSFSSWYGSGRRSAPGAIEAKPQSRSRGHRCDAYRRSPDGNQATGGGRPFLVDSEHFVISVDARVVYVDRRVISVDPRGSWG